MSYRRIRILLALAAVCWAISERIAPGSLGQTRAKTAGAMQDDSFQRVIAPFVAEHCTACHDASSRSGGLDLTAYASSEDVRAHRDEWERALEKVRGGEMPPNGAPRPPAPAIEAFAGSLASLIARFDHEMTPDPGRVTARRLNRAEYNNTVRDLLGVDFKPADDFPPDDSGYGFDNNGDVLSLSPLLMEKYLKAAERIAAAVIPVQPQTLAKIDPKHSPLGGNALQSSGSAKQRPPAATDISKRIFVCGHPYGQHNDGCARKIVAELAHRAYRRPVSRSEIDSLAKFVQLARDEGDPFEQGVRVALQAMLASPNFLFRIERDRGDAGAAHRIDDYEFASRLSYFLWSSMPDERLMQLAGSNRLHQPEVLTEQVRRMLADPKAEGLVENFGGQWLQLRNLDAVKPDPDRFPNFTPELRVAMKQETERFFTAILQEDRSVLDFIDGRFTFLNETLAKHYGVKGVEGKEFRRVSLDGTQRSGVLTQASVLTVSSYPTRTSPVIRGKWVLENILNAPPPPPPANVPTLDEKDVGSSASLRERLELHRANSVCASCHSKMDPLGFGLENYDAIGKWRTRDGKLPIDSSGTLPNGESFQTPAELKAILMKDRDAFAYGLTEKMLTYALGRGLERYDKPIVQSIQKRLAADQYKISRLILEITQSLPFQMRRGGP